MRTMLFRQEACLLGSREHRVELGIKILVVLDSSAFTELRVNHKNEDKVKLDGWLFKRSETLLVISGM